MKYSIRLGDDGIVLIPETHQDEITSLYLKTLITIFEDTKDGNIYVPKETIIQIIDELIRFDCISVDDISKKQMVDSL